MLLSVGAIAHFDWIEANIFAMWEKDPEAFMKYKKKVENQWRYKFIIKHWFKEKRQTISNDNLNYLDYSYYYNSHSLYWT